MNDHTESPIPKDADRSEDDYRRALEHALGARFISGNSIEPLQNGDEIFPAMLEAIESARKSVFLETFTWWTGQITQTFSDVLSAKAREGVPVRVLLDAYGAKKMDGAQEKQMVDAGVELRWFRPLSSWRFWKTDQRTHRKILVCDDDVGFIGGVGIASEWTGDARSPDEWRETHARVRGPVLADMLAAFLDNWNEAGPWLWLDPPDDPSDEPGEIPAMCVYASTTILWSKTAALIRALVQISQRSLKVTTAYLNPDKQLVDLLIEAANRGVDVDIMTPGTTTDSRLSQLSGHDSIEHLLRAGVTVRSYERTMLHAKVLIADDYVVCVGSANFNRRSMGKDEECCIVALSKPLATGLAERFETDSDDANRLSIDEWADRGGWLRMKERLARSISSQL